MNKHIAILIERLKATLIGAWTSVDRKNSYVMCSLCFVDEGLRRNASMIGVGNGNLCPSCGRTEGFKLSIENAEELCHSFFVRGTTQRLDYGGYPYIQFGQYQETDIHVSPWLESDIRLLEQSLQIGFFEYGPRFWMVGEIEPLRALQGGDSREKVIEDVIVRYPAVHLMPEQSFYRVRLNPDHPDDPKQYDSPPALHSDVISPMHKGGRLDDIDFPILYGSSDLELCLHECRATIEDSVYVAKLSAAKTLRLLNLIAVLEEEVDEFESLDLAIHFLFLASDHSYPICRAIAKHAREAGFDGILYPSYFSYARTGALAYDTVYGMSIRRLAPLKEYAQSQVLPNVALFGRPIEERKVKVECINRVVLTRVNYDITFGPIVNDLAIEETSDETGSK